MVFANVLALIVFLQASAGKLLSAVVDPLHPDRLAMEQAFTGFTIYAVSLLGLAAILALLAARRVANGSWRVALGGSRSNGSRLVAGGATRTRLSFGGLTIALTAAVVLVFIEVLIFQDYGVHFYEFDVIGILADAALRRDLGIQPVEVVRVTTAAVALLGAELALCWTAVRVARWRNGAVPRACGAALLVAAPGGFALFYEGERGIEADRAEFVSALPLGRQLLFRATPRPFIPAQPRLGGDGYPVPGARDAVPIIRDTKNVLLFVADGLRADMVRRDLTPNLLEFAARSDVIHSRRHLSTGHVSEAGIFGLTYALEGHAFHAFMAGRVPSFPMEVLRRNGYHTFLLASSRLSPYPSDQLLKSFDEVAYPKNDDDAVAALRDYVERRRQDGRPYFVLGFFYTPHYPFTSAKPHLRKFPMVGPRARSNYMNDVLQADDYFRQTLDLVRDDFERGRTIVVATSDHGEEIRDHGVFGHAPATFWNEKIVVPLLLGLPGARLTMSERRPSFSSHTDVWPTLLAALDATPLPDPASYSDGRSLVGARGARSPIAVTGRFFPYADRPSVLVDDRMKYWFRVSEVGAGNRLCIVVTRITGLDDQPVAPGDDVFARAMLEAFETWQSRFWRFIEPLHRRTHAETRVC